jgi:hypothetical protein
MTDTKKAVTIKEISGSCIETIPIGAEFTIITIVAGRNYATCNGLGVTSVWNDEYKLL